MSIMNRNKSPRLSDEAISGLIDPRTGQRLRPLGVVGGRTVWPIMGASPDDPSSEESQQGSNTEGEKKSSENDSGSSAGGEGGEAGGEKPKDNAQAKIEDLEEEKNRHVRRRQEAEERANKLQQELDAIKNKDKSEEEKGAERLTALETENTSLKETVQRLSLETAFLKDNKYEWHNPGRALSLVDLSSVEIDDDGVVHGLSKALDALAKSDSYLIKNKNGEKEEEKNPPPATEQKNKQEGKGEKETADARRARLLKKYPAVRR